MDDSFLICGSVREAQASRLSRIIQVALCLSFKSTNSKGIVSDRLRFGPRWGIDTLRCRPCAVWSKHPDAKLWTYRGHDMDHISCCPRPGNIRFTIGITKSVVASTRLFEVDPFACKHGYPFLPIQGLDLSIVGPRRCCEVFLCSTSESSRWVERSHQFQMYSFSRGKFPCERWQTITLCFRRAIHSQQHTLLQRDEGPRWIPGHADHGLATWMLDLVLAIARVHLSLASGRVCLHVFRVLRSRQPLIAADTAAARRCVAVGARRFVSLRSSAHYRSST